MARRTNQSAARTDLQVLPCALCKGAQLEDERRRAAQQARLELDLHAGIARSARSARSAWGASRRPRRRRPRVLSERRLEGRTELLLILDVVPELSLHSLHHLVDGQRRALLLHSFGLVFDFPKRSKEAGALGCTARGRRN
eukprot:scaffold102409_cov60-Phaeocystis_antarctica.AAC.2